MRRKIGSPPQVRGKLGFWLSLRAVLRITPAGAGKTGRLDSVRRWSEDHPRRCGENVYVSGRRSDVEGRRRITPAGAGKTLQSSSTRSPSQDHPRRCGENFGLDFIGVCREGSPPQVRGKRQKEIARAVHGRITPAGAGKTCNSGCNNGCG